VPHVQRLLQDLVFYGRLERCDQEIAEERRGEGCGACGGRLHQAHYRRRPRGGPPVGLGATFSRRFSYCCGGCRARTTPASVRFLGRKVYLAPVVMLLPAMGRRFPPRVVALVRQSLGPSLRTFRRWLAFWTELVPRAPFWRTARARLMPPVDEAALPASLVDRFASGDDYVDVERALAFVSPISTETARR